MNNSEKITDCFELLVSAKQSLQNAHQTSCTKGCTMVEYSPKSIAIFGNTKLIKEELKRMGGKFNSRLTYQGNKVAGWIFHISKEKQLAHYFGLN